VDDRSTATIMASLYKLRESQKLSRVSALQQAQLAMIRAAAAAAPRAARPAPAGAAPNRAASRVRLPGDPEPEPAPATPAPSAPAKLGAAHPFFWAPFVLMGNWL
jgi:CHAT domain-containing protein